MQAEKSTIDRKMENKLEVELESEENKGVYTTTFFDRKMIEM